MGIGFGSLKHMNDTIRQNREMLGKKKKNSLRDRYKEEAQKVGVNIGNADLEEVRMRIRQNIRRSNVHSLYTRITAFTVGLLLIGGLAWVFNTVDFTIRKDANKRKPQYLIKYYPINEHLVNKSEHFQNGLPAAETFFLDGRKNHESKSWYESGELFRTATYYNDTLLTETYFLKTGDTIRNFPAADSLIRHITIEDSKTKKHIRFDVIDGKVVEKSYTESPLDIPQQ